MLKKERPHIYFMLSQVIQNGKTTSLVVLHINNVSLDWCIGGTSYNLHVFVLGQSILFNKELASSKLRFTVTDYRFTKL